MYKNLLEIDILRCINALLKRKMLILIVSVLFLIIGTGLTLNPVGDKYSATATAYAAADTSYSDAANAVTAMNAYIGVAKSYKVCQRAALIMGRGDVEASDIQGAVSVNTSAKNTSGSSSTNFMNSAATIISFTATTADPELSMEMADAMVQSYTMEMSDILHSDSVKSLDNAYTYSKSVSSIKEAIKKRLLFMVAGFVLVCAIIVFCEIFDRKVRTVREATIRNSLPVLGIIPDYKE